MFTQVFIKQARPYRNHQNDATTILKLFHFILTWLTRTYLDGLMNNSFRPFGTATYYFAMDRIIFAAFLPIPAAVGGKKSVVTEKGGRPRKRGGVAVEQGCQLSAPLHRGDNSR